MTKPTAPSPAAASPALSVVRSVASPGSSPEGSLPDEHLYTFGDRCYRVRGLEANTSPTALRVTVLVRRGEHVHADTLDLYLARQRAGFLQQAANELAVRESVLKHDLGQLLANLEEVRDARLRALLAPPPAVELSEAERIAATGLLEDPRLLERILADFEECGVVGEKTNKVVGYLAAVSRKLAEPLAVVIQSSSAAGKTSLMDGVLAFVPPEDRYAFSAVTGRALFYLGARDLKHKVLAVAEEEGAGRAGYALKLLQSEGALSIASTGHAHGRAATEERRVEGPVALFLTTTAVSVDEELMNRCLVLTVDEDREQTRAIHRVQREGQTLDGLLARRRREEVRALHRNAQRLLRPLVVVNPFAPELTFLDDRTRTRRDHAKYLTLIKAVTLLFQRQREVKSVEVDGAAVEYVEATAADVAVANGLVGQVLRRSLDDMPPHTRRLLGRIRAFTEARGGARFTRRELRDECRWGSTQLKVHLQRLVDLEYLVAHGGGRGRLVTYELLWGTEPGETVCGLAVVGEKAGGSRGPEVVRKPSNEEPLAAGWSEAPGRTRGGA